MKRDIVKDIEIMEKLDMCPVCKKQRSIDYTHPTNLKQ